MELEQPLNRFIESTLLTVDANMSDLNRYTNDAIKYSFASICVSPHLASAAVDRLCKYPDINVGTVVSFPHGNLPVDLKLQEVQYFVDAGVDEIDFVINIGNLKAGRYEEVGKEIETIGAFCQANDVISKCIVEACYLNQDEKIFMYRALEERTAVNFIKTTTGFGTSGANLADVFLWNSYRQEVKKSKEEIGITFSPYLPAEAYLLRDGQSLQIKAAGGITCVAEALKFIACGADRLGISASVKVMEEWNARNQPRTFIEGEEST